MLSQIAAGVFLVALCGGFGVFELIFSKVLMDSGWPYFHLGAANMLLIGVLMGIAFRVARGTRPTRLEVKWLLLRSLFSNGTIIFGVLALKVGADPGDVAALTSINVVIAALMGHAFLGERLRPAHGVSLLCSVAGGLLIAQPAFLFGGGGGGSAAGNVLALLCGLLQACIFIAARKSADVSGFCASGVESFLGVLLYLCVPLVVPSNTSFENVASHPDVTVGYVAVLFLLTTVGIVTGCVGSQMCPAAAGATVMTVSSTVTGYVCQAALFGAPPAALKVAGASLMLAAVGGMAMVGSGDPTAAGGAGGEAAEAQEEQPPGAASNAGEWECGSNASGGSLASFAAVEFTTPWVRESRPVRLRRPAGTASSSATSQQPQQLAAPAAQTVGAAAALAVAASGASVASA